MCTLLPILMMSKDADTAHCKVVWACAVGYIVL